MNRRLSLRRRNERYVSVESRSSHFTLLYFTVFACTLLFVLTSCPKITRYIYFYCREPSKTEEDNPPVICIDKDEQVEMVSCFIL